MNDSFPATWLDAARSFAALHKLPAWVVDDLAAFHSAFPRGGPPAPPEPAFLGDFAALEAARPYPLDADAVTALLLEEAEGRQPAMFARRVAAVERLLEEIATPAARVLRIGLRMRLEGMCSAPPPRLRRVRALADFYYSLAARLRHPEWVEETHHLDTLLAALAWRRVEPGLEHAIVDGLALGMPVHVNLLRVDPDRVRCDVVDLQVESRAGRSLADVLRGRASAAISGGFFLYSEDDICPPSRRHDPVGLLIADGIVHSPPVFQRAGLLISEAGIEIRRVGLLDVGVRIAGTPVEILETWNRARAVVGPDAPSLSIVGGQILAKGRSLAVPLNGFVATLAAACFERVRLEDPVTYEPPEVAGARAYAGICGGPLLVDNGRPVLDMRAEDFWGSAPPITFSQDETGDRNLLARMVIGVDAEGRLLAAAIDGRNVQRALGMTLADASRLMIGLGCVRAANMDGGSSKRMFVDGKVVDLPSTEIVAGESDVTRIRPVHTALLFRGTSPASGPPEA